MARSKGLALAEKAPVIPAQRLSDEATAMLRHAYVEAEHANWAAQKAIANAKEAKAALDQVQGQITKLYQLGEKDRIDVGTGLITRAPEGEKP